MNTFAFIAFFALLAVTNAGYYGPSAKILQGPSSKTTLVGPDGSVISAVAPGGQIIHEEHPGYVAHAAPVAAYSTYAAHAPVVAHHAPLAYAAPVAYETHISKYGSHITHGAPAVSYGAHAYAAPLAYASHAAPVAYASHAAPLAYAAHSPVVGHHGVVDSVVAGPSGTIATSHSALVSPYHSHGVYGAHYGGHQGLYI